MLYPAYGTYLVGTASILVAGPVIYAIEAGVVIPAHIVGRVKAHNIPPRLEAQPEPSHAPAVGDKTTRTAPQD